MRQEAQAIVLAAGPGMRMTSLTSHTPKCLLPLGTLPMLCYPLHLLQQAGFSEVSVVVSEGQEQRVSKVVEQYGLKVDLDVAVVSTAHDPGTADSLRHIASKIKRSVEDVVVISSDLVTNVVLQDVMDQHRTRGADLTMLTSPTPSLPTTPPGPKTKANLNSDIICTEAGSGRVVYAVAGGDYDESVTLPSALLSCAAPLHLSASTQDAHLYVIKRWLLDYALNKESPSADMGSLKAEILPYIVSCQFADPSSNGKTELSGMVEREEWDALVRKYNSSVVPSRHHTLALPQPPVCLTYHHPGLCVRANTLHTYWYLNCKINELFDQVYPNSKWQLRHPTAEIHERAQVSEDSVVGGGAAVCEKTNIASSVVGNHCRVSPMVRLSASVLGDYVTLASGCVIENSLILASVEKKCVIKNCIVTDPNKIEEGKTYSGEVLEATQDFA